ncbi:MAG TPA: M14 family zinc carboxypeptidase, partial [Vicinamibacterales bacterium]|nr:M14 family zinc carboxypeptidase [Vicinamibacterales bacterium]
MKRLTWAIALAVMPTLLLAAGADQKSKSAAPAKPMTDAELAAAKPGRDPNQPIDEEYTKKIKEYTTETFFLSPLVDYMPAAKGIPTPKAVLGDIAGAAGKLPYSKEVYEYMRLLEKSTPRVKVYSIGTTEEGREMLAVAVASDALMAKLEQNKADLAKLADPRTIQMNDAMADEIAKRAAPIYYITGTIHSTEAGAPTALMELAYRLAVDESPYIRNIREHVITLITPIVEVDGRDRVVDLYEYRKKHPNDVVPDAIYWGHYVRHDNNRDAMALTLKLSQNVLDAYLGKKVPIGPSQVLHDLHESGSFLYDNTIGDGPYNAWLDPILTNEWQLIGWNNVNEMTRMGMPGVFAFGTFDTWSPGYLMFMAATHNGISRLYETFGNGGNADTQDRTLSANETSRTWYRQNPPLPRVRWSLRNNNNYEMTGILISENYIASNRLYFLRNFYDKSKRSILKAKTEGPAAYVLPASDPRLGSQAELLRVLQKQGVEISRATADFTVTVPGKRGPARQNPTTTDGSASASLSAERSSSGGPSAGQEGQGGQTGREGQDRRDGQDRNAPPPPVSRTFPAGSYIVRMDQPYSRIADSLMDYQYWSPNDPQKTPYDDTGWTFPELFNVQAVRVADVKVLNAPIEKVTGPVRAKGASSGTGSIYLVNHNADVALATLRYTFKDASFEAAEEPFDAAGKKFNRGSFIIRNAQAGELQKAAADLGLQMVAVSAAPTVKTHPVRAPRVALLHTWLSTQTEGWWR